VPDKGNGTVFGECAGSCNKCLVVASQLRLTSRRDTSQQRLGQGARRRSRGRSGAKNTLVRRACRALVQPEENLRKSRRKGCLVYIANGESRAASRDVSQLWKSRVTKTRGNAEEGICGGGVAGLAVENGAAWGVGNWWLAAPAFSCCNPANTLCKCVLFKLGACRHGDNATEFKQMICDRYRNAHTRCLTRRAGDLVFLVMRGLEDRKSWGIDSPTDRRVPMVGHAGLSGGDEAGGGHRGTL
jgi:hypothetical protein